MINNIWMINKLCIVILKKRKLFYVQKYIILYYTYYGFILNYNTSTFLKYTPHFRV